MMFYYVASIIDLHIFDKEKAITLIFFENCMKMHSVSLFFLNERNISTCLLMLHLKRTIVHYANLNSSSINKPFLNYGPLNMLFCWVFLFLIYVYFNEAFVKTSMKKLSFFNTNLQNSFNVVYYRILGCQTLRY